MTVFVLQMLIIDCLKKGTSLSVVIASWKESSSLFPSQMPKIKVLNSHFMSWFL